MAEVRQGNGPLFALTPLSLMDADWSDAYHNSVYTSLRATADYGEAGESVSGCWEKISNLADRAGCSERTFHDRASDLRDRGWIEWKSGREDGGRNEYVVHFSPARDAEGSARDAEEGLREMQTLPTKNHTTEKQNQEDTNWDEMSDSEALRNSSPSSPCPRISEVFDHAVRRREEEFSQLAKGPSLKLTKKRHGKIRARLQEGFSVDMLKAALEGLLVSEWHVENNQLDPRFAWKDDERVRSMIAKYEKHKKSKDGGSSRVRYWDE